MDAERIARFVERQVHGWEDPAGVADLAADYGADGVFRHPFDPPARGADAVRRVYERFHATCADAAVALGPVLAEGNRLAFEWTFEFTVGRSGRRTRIPGLTIANLLPDRIETWFDYWDSRCLFDYIAEPWPGQTRRPIRVIAEAPRFDPDRVTVEQVAGWDDPAQLEAMYAGWAAGAVFTDPITPTTDLAGLREVFERAHRLNDRITTTLVNRVAAGDVLVLEWTIDSRGRRSGREVRLDGGSWIELRDGSIIVWRDYWDTEQIRPRRGIVPPA